MTLAPCWDVVVPSLRIHVPTCASLPLLAFTSSLKASWREGVGVLCFIGCPARASFIVTCYNHEAPALPSSFMKLQIQPIPADWQLDPGNIQESVLSAASQIFKARSSGPPLLPLCYYLSPLYNQRKTLVTTHFYVTQQLLLKCFVSLQKQMETITTPCPYTLLLSRRVCLLQWQGFIQIN